MSLKLRFYARGIGLVTLPGERRIVGQQARYVGRALRIIDGAAAYPATAEPFECSAASEMGRRLIELTVRDAALWPADEATAKACGVPFTPVAFDDGEWVKAPPNDSQPRSHGGSKKKD